MNQNYQQNQYRYQTQHTMNQNYQISGSVPPKRNRKPIHTAFFSNIPFDLPIERFKDFVQSFGDIAHIYSLIPKKGIAFVTYNDIRNAEKAVEEGNDFMFGNRPVKTNYADKSHFPHQDPRDTCSTILIRSMTQSPKVKVHEIISQMKEYGELQSAIPVDGQPGTFIVKYSKIKDAKRAMENPNLQIGQEPCVLSFKTEDESNPDIQSQPKQQQPQYRQPTPMQGQGMYQQGYPPPPPQQQQGQPYQRMPPPPPPNQQMSSPQQMQQPPYYQQQQPYYSQSQSNQQQPPPPQYGAPPPPPPQQQHAMRHQSLQKLKEFFDKK